jgi:hypothetical protein
MIGQGNNPQRIERWLTAVVFGANAPAGGLRLTLHHASIDEAARLLRTWDLDALPQREEFDRVVEEIDREAGEDASQLGWGVQRYVLRAATTEGRDLGSLTLRYSANSSPSGELGAFIDSEPASARGQVALAMRHTDGAYRLLGAGFGTILDSLNRRLAQQDVLLEKMMSAQTRLYELMGEMADKRIEREVWAEAKKKEAEIELHRQIAELDRKDMWTKMGFERLAPLIPVVLTKLAGKDAAPTQPTPRDEVLAGIMESLTPQQFAGLEGTLNQSQMAALMSLVEDLQRTRSPVTATPCVPGTSSPNCKPSDETGVLAVARITRELLPWVTERLRSGQPLDMPTELATVTKIFKLLVTALPQQQYDELVTRDGPLSPIERAAFARLAVHLKLAPEGAVAPPPMPDTKTPAPIGPNLADIAKLPKGVVPSMPTVGLPEPKKGK